MITIHNLITGYYGQKITPSISGQIISGSILVVVGANGIGKSTFLKTLAGLLPPISGKIEFSKTNSSNIISYLPQKGKMDYYFPITVFEVVSMGCWPKINFFKKLNHHQKYLVWEALSEVKLLKLIHKCIDNLSGGQFQRMLFARILVQQASYILLDEPFQGIDQKTCKILACSIDRLCQKGCAIVIALHDKQFLTEYFTYNTLLLTQKNSIWQSPK